MEPTAERRVRAAEVMQKNLVTIDGMATAFEAVEKMRAKQVSSLIVERRNSDDALALVTLQDLVDGVLVAGRSSRDVNVYEIMTKPIVTVPPEMDIRYVARLLQRFALRRVVVVEGTEPVGMISLSSLVLENQLF